MLKFLDWLSTIAWKKPRTLAFFLLVIGLIIVGRVVIYQQKRVVELENKLANSNDDCNRRIDSLTLYFLEREIKLNAETKGTLNTMIEDYKQQLREQRNLNKKVNSTIIENDRALRNTQEKLKQVSNDQ